MLIIVVSYCILPLQLLQLELMMSNRLHALKTKYCSQLTEIPIPKVDRAFWKPILVSVDRILAVKARSPQAYISALERKTDQMVYQRYGLEEEAK
jgi:hypothetical protein